MLTPSYLLHAAEPAEDIAEELHQNIMNRIIERILIRFGRGDGYILTPLDKYQIETLQQLGYLLGDIQKEIAKATGKMQTEIAAAMEDAGVKALGYDDAIYREAGLNPTPLVQSPYLQKLMQDTYEQTLGEWKNFTATTADAVQETFTRLCDEAYMRAMSGAISPVQAVREAVERLVSDGVYIKYTKIGSDGTERVHKDTIEVATARAVRTGISQGSARIQLARMDEMGVNLVIVSSHLGARPTHEVWQGKIYSRVPSTEYPDFVSSTQYGTVTGLCGANCRHNFSVWFPGQGNPFEDYDSEENKKQYEKEQKQRAMERRIRDTKRKVLGLRTAMDKALSEEERAGFEKEYRKKSALLQQQNEAYNAYCKETGQKKRADRIAIALWNRSEAAKATAAARKYNAEKE